MISSDNRQTDQRPTLGQIGLPRKRDSVDLLSDSSLEAVWLVTLGKLEQFGPHVGDYEFVKWISEDISELPPDCAWKQCDMCEDFACTFCRDHVADCECEPIEYWEHSNPYLSHHPKFEVDIVKVNWPGMVSAQLAKTFAAEVARSIRTLLPLVVIFEHGQALGREIGLDVISVVPDFEYTCAKFENRRDVVVFHRTNAGLRSVGKIHGLVRGLASGCLE